MEQEKKIFKYLIALIVISTVIRGVLAYILELGNDEVYYWLYATFPDLSHFDHPPMVGLFIQFFSLNLFFQNEFFIRLSSVLFGAVNTWLIYKIGEKLRNPLCGLYTAVIYNCSVYCFIITGVFILPDTPLSFFWLLSLYLLLPALTEEVLSKTNRRKMLLAGCTIGMAMLSKYTGAYLWVASLAYIIFFNRKWLLTAELYISLFISLLFFSPVIWWNYSNHFISFAFQGERVNLFSSGLNFNSFLTELFGQILYNNPVVFFIIAFILYKLFRSQVAISSTHKRFLLMFSLPLILSFLCVSLFRGTLPHWSASGYMALIILAGYYFSSDGKIFFYKSIKIAMTMLLLVLVVGVTEIFTGIIPIKGNDVTLDMYGWTQLKSKFETILNRDLQQNKVSKNIAMVSYRWFPAAHLDYYVATPLNLKLFALGNIQGIHKYAWINNIRGGMAQGGEAYCLVPVSDFKDPEEILSSWFSAIQLSDSIPILRNNKIANWFYIYRLSGYNGKSLSELCNGI
jgi:4-amino-4-deoxy-L-arabinose transferase-like glycosyltransferase